MVLSDPQVLVRGMTEHITAIINMLATDVTSHRETGGHLSKPVDVFAGEREKQLN